MEAGLVLLIFFIGWYLLSMLLTWWTEGRKDRDNIASFIFFAWAIGGTLFILGMAGIL